MKRNPWKFLVLLIVFDNTVKCILLKNNRFLEISVSGDQEHHASNLTGLQYSKGNSFFLYSSLLLDLDKPCIGKFCRREYLGEVLRDQ